MKYKIYGDGKLVAIFENEFERDLCLSCLQEEFPDCKFTKRL